MFINHQMSFSYWSIDTIEGLLHTTSLHNGEITPVMINPDRQVNFIQVRHHGSKPLLAFSRFFPPKNEFSYSDTNQPAYLCICSFATSDSVGDVTSRFFSGQILQCGHDTYTRPGERLHFAMENHHF